MLILPLLPWYHLDGHTPTNQSDNYASKIVSHTLQNIWFGQV